jgi:uncharacterized membrane protein YukC
MLLSKALRIQQYLEDKKNEIIIKGLESKIKDYEATLEQKDFLLQATEGSLMELQTENARLNEGLLQAQETLKKNSERFKQENKNCKQNAKPKLTIIRSCMSL